jgi:t-SNARE complex subunit (syntaxin)
MTVKTNIEVALSKLGLSELHMGDMTVLVKTETDLQDFMDNYWIKKDMQFESINAFRADKIKNNPVSYESFKEKYLSENKAISLESLFFHKIHNNHVKMLEKRFESGTLNLKKLYDWYVANTKCRMLSLVLETNY